MNSGCLVWFEADPTDVLHWTNTYEDGGEIVLDGFFQRDPSPPSGGGTLYQRMFRFLDNELIGPRLHRWRLDLKTGLAREEDVTGGPVCRVQLPERVTSGTHPTWAPGHATPQQHDDAASALGLLPPRRKADLQRAASVLDQTRQIDHRSATPMSSARIPTTSSWWRLT